jgi:hypothetical protein
VTGQPVITDREEPVVSYLTMRVLFEIHDNRTIRFLKDHPGFDMSSDNPVLIESRIRGVAWPIHTDEFVNFRPGRLDADVSAGLNPNPPKWADDRWAHRAVGKALAVAGVTWPTMFNATVDSISDHH